WRAAVLDANPPVASQRPDSIPATVFAPPAPEPAAPPVAHVAPPAAPARPAASAASRPARKMRAGVDPGVTKVLAGLGLVTAYVAVCLAPLAIVSLGYHAPRRPFLVELSVALGYVGLAMMVLQFTLVSRIRWLSRPFGIDILHRFHRQVSFVALAFVLAHPALLLVQSLPTYLPLFDLRTAPWRARFAVSSVIALLLVVFVSVWR